MHRGAKGSMDSASLLIVLLAAVADRGRTAPDEERRLRDALWEHHRYLLSLLRYKTGSDETAEDLLQETYLSFLRNSASRDAIASRGAETSPAEGYPPRFQDSKKLKNYLTTIALNKVRDYFRGPHSPSRRLSFRNPEEAEAWLENLPAREAGQEERLADEAEAAERRNLTAAAMERLPERYRGALELKFARGMDNPAAAAALGLGIKALESLLVRAKAAFKKEFLALSAAGPNEKGGDRVDTFGGGPGE
jgi:RNA polymerase sigma-70 factor (ECF subfamily)